MSLSGRGETGGQPPGDGPRWAADVFRSAMRPALTVPAAGAAAGALTATRLPGRAATRQPEDRPVERLPDEAAATERP